MTESITIENVDDFSCACVISCLKANRANTLALLEVLRACEQERPYREVEDEVDALPIMHMSHQNAHVLINLLVDAGGLERIAVEGACEEGICGSTDACKSTDEADAHEGPSVEGELNADVPDDYHIVITPAGSCALAEFEPTKRFSELVAHEPAIYGQAYRLVLETCEAGVRREAVECALRDNPCLSNPKPIYPGYFISKLEAVGGIAWEENAWHTTPAGLRMKDLCVQAGSSNQAA